MIELPDYPACLSAMGAMIRGVADLADRESPIGDPVGKAYAEALIAEAHRTLSAGLVTFDSRDDVLRYVRRGEPVQYDDDEEERPWHARELRDRLNRLERAGQPAADAARAALDELRGSGWTLMRFGDGWQAAYTPDDPVKRYSRAAGGTGRGKAGPAGAAKLEAIMALLFDAAATDDDDALDRARRQAGRIAAMSDAEVLALANDDS